MKNSGKITAKESAVPFALPLQTKNPVIRQNKENRQTYPDNRIYRKTIAERLIDVCKHSDFFSHIQRDRYIT